MDNISHVSNQQSTGRIQQENNYSVKEKQPFQSQNMKPSNTYTFKDFMAAITKMSSLCGNCSSKNCEDCSSNVTKALAKEMGLEYSKDESFYKELFEKMLSEGKLVKDALGQDAPTIPSDESSLLQNLTKVLAKQEAEQGFVINQKNDIQAKLSEAGLEPDELSMVMKELNSAGDAKSLHLALDKLANQKELSQELADIVNLYDLGTLLKPDTEKALAKRIESKEALDKSFKESDEKVKKLKDNQTFRETFIDDTMKELNSDPKFKDDLTKLDTNPAQKQQRTHNKQDISEKMPHASKNEPEEARPLSKPSKELLTLLTKAKTGSQAKQLTESIIRQELTNSPSKPIDSTISNIITTVMNDNPSSLKPVLEAIVQVTIESAPSQLPEALSQPIIQIATTNPKELKTVIPTLISSLNENAPELVLPTLKNVIATIAKSHPDQVHHIADKVVKVLNSINPDQASQLIKDIQLPPLNHSQSKAPVQQSQQPQPSHLSQQAQQPAQQTQSALPQKSVSPTQPKITQQTQFFTETPTLTSSHKAASAKPLSITVQTQGKTTAQTTQQPTPIASRAELSQTLALPKDSPAVINIQSAITTLAAPAEQKAVITTLSQLSQTISKTLPTAVPEQKEAIATLKESVISLASKSIKDPSFKQNTAIIENTISQLGEAAQSLQEASPNHTAVITIAESLADTVQSPRSFQKNIETLLNLTRQVETTSSTETKLNTLNTLTKISESPQQSKELPKVISQLNTASQNAVKLIADSSFQQTTHTVMTVLTSPNTPIQQTVQLSASFSNMSQFMASGLIPQTISKPINQLVQTAAQQIPLPPNNIEGTAKFNQSLSKLNSLMSTIAALPEKDIPNQLRTTVSQLLNSISSQSLSASQLSIAADKITAFSTAVMQLSNNPKLQTLLLNVVNHASFTKLPVKHQLMFLSSLTTIANASSKINVPNLTSTLQNLLNNITTGNNPKLMFATLKGLESVLVKLEGFSKSIQQTALNLINGWSTANLKPELMAKALTSLATLLGALSENNAKILNSILTHLAPKDQAALVIHLAELSQKLKPEQFTNLLALLSELMQSGQATMDDIQKLIALFAQQNAVDVGLEIELSQNATMIASAAAGNEEVKIKRLKESNAKSLHSLMVRKDASTQMFLALFGKMFIQEDSEDVTGGIASWQEYLDQSKTSDKNSPFS